VNKKLRILFSVALLGLVAWRTDWQQVSHAFRKMHGGFWVAALGTYLLTQIVSALRWRILARPLGFDRPLSTYAGFYFIGMYFNLVLPTSVGGDVVRAWYLDGHSGRRARAFLSVFVDRLSGLVILIALAGIATVLCPIELPTWIRVSVWSAVGCAAVGLAVLPWLARLPLFQARLKLGEDFSRCLALVFQPRVLGLSVFVQAANVVIVWLVGRAISAPVPLSYYWVLVPMVTLITLVPVSINGLGVREGGTLLFLAPLGVPAATAVMLAFLWFCVYGAAGLSGGLVYLFGRFPRLEVQTNHETIGHHPDQGRAGQSSAAA
jgi:uncharacterized membrane protein YbhN (UPF0104 family)